MCMCFVIQNRVVVIASVMIYTLARRRNPTVRRPDPLHSNDQGTGNHYNTSRRAAGAVQVIAAVRRRRRRGGGQQQRRRRWTVAAAPSGRPAGR